MAPIETAKIDFIYDISSPNSYIIFVTLLRYRKAWNLDINLRPVSLDGITAVTGPGAANPVPIKKAYIDRDFGRMAERWGLDIRLPPGRPSPASLLKLTHFLHALKDVESPDVLTQCTVLFFEEYYSIHTSPVAPTFYDCVIKGHPASRGQGPLSESRFKEIWALAASAEIQERAQKDVEEVVSKFKTFSCPWIVAYKVPLDDRPLSREEKLKNPIERTDYQSFFGPDRMDTLAYYLGPEYEWKGPFPDGRERFLPRALGLPGLPVEFNPKALNSDLKAML